MCFTDSGYMDFLKEYKKVHSEQEEDKREVFSKRNNFPLRDIIQRKTLSSWQSKTTSIKALCSKQKQRI